MFHCPFDIKFTAKSQRTQSKFFFSLSAERPESEKNSPSGSILICYFLIVTDKEFNFFEPHGPFCLPSSQRQT